MPIASVNGIDVNYSLEGDGSQTIVLVNGLADDLNTWELQMADLLAAGYRVLRFTWRQVVSQTLLVTVQIAQALNTL